MRHSIVSFLVLLVVVFVSFELSAQEKKKSADLQPQTNAEDTDLVAILQAGQDANALPPGVVVRVEANLSKSAPADDEERAEAEARGVDFTQTLQETWEFTSNHVHRIVIEKNRDKVVYRRVKSLPFDSKNFCKDLLDGKLLAIAKEEGTGKPLQFVGTDYDLGGRSIEIFVNGKSALWVGESCLFAGYAETDARAFAAIYEKLATQARVAFNVKPALAAPPMKTPNKTRSTRTK